MHAEAFNFVARAARDITARQLKIVELGSRDVNGSVRPLFAGHDYTGLDIAPGDGVDVVADGAEWGETATYDLGLCLEVLEHAPNAGAIVANLRRIVRPGGMLIITAATEPRPPHSGTDGGPLPEGEYYCNIAPEWLMRMLRTCPYRNVEVERGDIRAIATVG